MKTKLTEILGTEYPMIQGGMAWVADANLAAAVSNGGALGLIAAGSMNGELLRQEIRKCRTLTDKPFGVNIMLMNPCAEELAKVVIEEKIHVVTTGAGSPGKFVPAWKEAGIRVIPVVASTGLARRMESLGVDAVVAEGCEAGGHIGELTTMVLVPQVVDAVSIPVIASVNCISASDWVKVAKDMEDAGASALELNLSMMPSDPQRNCEQQEASYLAVLNGVTRTVSIPVAAKISPHLTALTNTAMKFSWTGIKGLVLFNRYYAPDIDLATLSVVPGALFSAPSEASLPLRWTAVLADRVACDIAATTGIHDGETAVKMMLAGARAVQVCSVLYQRGNSQIGKILKQMEKFMLQNGYESTSGFIGKMSLRSIENPASYERIQFMKHFSQIE